MIETNINVVYNSFDFINHYYKQPHRYYHNKLHVTEMVNVADKLKIDLSCNQLVAIAFHDIVYLPGTPVGFNEDQSVKLLRTFAKLNPGSIDDEALKVIGNIILDTIDHKATIEESEIVLDLDLHVLSLSWEDYINNTGLIRTEYILFNDEQFKNGRIEFLSDMLKRDNIYHTEIFRNTFEENARGNLNRELDALVA